MSKHNCRRLPDEKQQHEFATKIRKMTDAQLCSFIDEIQHSKENDDVAQFLNRLEWMSGTGNRIGRATVAKLKAFAKSEGYIRKDDFIEKNY